MKFYCKVLELDKELLYWNLDGLCARDGVIAVSESMLDSPIKNDDIFIKGFSNDIDRRDHPSNTKIGRVCLFHRDELLIKCWTDLELLQEIIVSEISLSKKK